MECVKEETFGPTLPIMKVHTVEEAIEAANRSMYGLNAYVYGKDPKETRRVAERLEAGTVMINETLITHGAPETPWQGVKKSGVGRVHSDDGLRDLCVGYHVNEEVVPTPKWSPFWQPYSHKMYRTLIHAARMMNHSSWTEKAKGAVGFVDLVMQQIRSR